MRYASNTTSCRKCGRRIHFIRTTAGKSMPCDCNLVFFKEGGPDRVVLESGKVVAATILEGPVGQWDGYGYISHFATCEYSEMFRRKRKKTG